MQISIAQLSQGSMLTFSVGGCGFKNQPNQVVTFNGITYSNDLLARSKNVSEWVGMPIGTCVYASVS